MQITPITLKEAARFVSLYHRHHGPDRGGFFAIAVSLAIYLFQRAALA